MILNQPFEFLHHQPIGTAKIVSEYDQEISPSQTADKLMASLKVGLCNKYIFCFGQHLLIASYIQLLTDVLISVT